MPPRAKKESDEPPRRSSRIKSSASEDAPQPKPKAAPKKRTKDTEGGEETEGEGKASVKKKAKTEEEPEKTFNIGDVLPAITVQDEKGEDVQVDTLTAEKGVVIFLVPKAATPGCTTQACGFRDVHPDFTSVDYDVYCLSADSPTAQTKWQSKHSLPYPLLSDPKRELISALGAGKTKTARSHFIFEKGGKLIDKKLPVKPKDSPTLALEFIKQLAS
ncbi:AhpC-TSA-domain-containing protein [Hymenopellis radicata]|nr:AhpC-TSA-domain-containing protein [Hymenopellis radicata]